LTGRQTAWGFQGWNGNKDIIWKISWKASTRGKKYIGDKGLKKMDYQGGSQTQFFHQFANGRRRKSTILWLESEQQQQQQSL